MISVRDGQKNRRGVRTYAEIDDCADSSLTETKNPTVFTVLLHVIIVSKFHLGGSNESDGILRARQSVISGDHCLKQQKLY